MSRRHLTEFQDPDNNARTILAILAGCLFGVVCWTGVLWLLWEIIR